MVRHERWTGRTLVHWVSQVAADTAHTLCSMLHEALGERALFSLSSSGLTFLLFPSLPFLALFLFPCFPLIYSDLDSPSLSHLSRPTLCTVILF